MSSTPSSSRPLKALLVGVALTALGAAALTAPRNAQAAVIHSSGFEATVLGWTSWYGSYEIPGVGAAWCIDHGLQAPDGAFGYQPAAVADRPVWAQTAMAWITSRNQSTDPLSNAAVMLVLHDLGGALYPYGRLDVDHLTSSQLAGFGHASDELLLRARSIKADGLAHAQLRPPLHLALKANRRPAGVIAATARIHDDAGTPLAGLAVTLSFGGDQATINTGADGTATTTWIGTADSGRVEAQAIVPDLVLHILAPQQVAAQRVAVPTTVELRAHAMYEAAIPPTTTTTTTTTTIPPTTTTTTIPPTTIPPTTTTTTIPPAPPEVGLPPAPPPPDAPPGLVQTGAPLRGIVLIAAGLLCIGWALESSVRPSRRTSHRHH